MNLSWEVDRKCRNDDSLLDFPEPLELREASDSRRRSKPLVGDFSAVSEENEGALIISSVFVSDLTIVTLGKAS